ncbi:HAD family hydrolase [Cellulomonas sp. 179-A 9B4 NHS]|uniref:HAD family hydrolase n=1 Tax=Cellulomonas sp. 179-A 9B4 NHS TaxID=3142379 RepID=UPI0039A0824F
MIALLDLDRTLVDRDAGFAVWARAFAEEWGLTDEDVAWLHAEDRVHRQRGPFFDAVHARLPHTGAPADRWRAYRSLMPRVSPAFPGVVDALGDLRSEGWRLVVVTNGRTQTQVRKLRRTGVADVVHAWYVSEQVGARKPEGAIFAAALAGAGAAAAQEAWMVGDDPVADVGGGRAAGLRTAWVAHGRVWPAPDEPPDLVAPTPRDALAALAALPR